MRKKKKGATLIVTIILFMFVCSVSMAMLSMIAGNYRARVSESKRIENLYSSESGIDMAYNITGKTIGAGIKYGYYEVSQMRCGENGPNKIYYDALNDDINDLKQQIKVYENELQEVAGDNYNDVLSKIEKCKKGIDTDTATLNELYKEEFKRAFKLYIQKEESDSVVSNTDVLRKSIEGKKYTDISLTYENENNSVSSEVKGVNIKFTDYKVESSKPKVDDNEWPLLSVKKLYLNKCLPDKKVTITNNCNSDETHVNTVEFNRTTGEYYDLTLQSQFASTDKNSDVLGKNIRIIEASYKIAVPDYQDVLWSSSGEDLKNYSIFNRGLIIGGNMDINEVNQLNVKGDIFVQGKAPGVSDVTLDNKYKGGIKITDSGAVNFTPLNDETRVYVSTRGTFNVQDDSDVSIGSEGGIDGNLYAANIYFGDSEDGSNFSDNSTLAVNNDVVIDNDLTVKATNTNLTMNNFYGINSTDIKENGEEDNGFKTEKTSSSIIINGHEDATGKNTDTIKILKEAYIMGAANINTENKYKTGESIAVKGNYIAYAAPVSPNEVFKYDKPLQVLDEENVFKKADHFTNYWNGNGIDGVRLTKSNADNGGIILPDNSSDIHSIGAIVYKTLSDSKDEKTLVRSSNYNIGDEQPGGPVYVKKVQYAKNVYELGIKSYDDNHDYMEEYLKGENGAEKVSSLLGGLSALTNADLPSGYDWRNELKNANENESVAIFNPSTDSITIDKSMKALIVTNGDVIINGEVNFKGIIIAGGNLTVEKGANISIEYDKDILNDIQENYSKTFDTVFGQFEKTPLEDENSDDKTVLKQVLDGDYDIKKYLENRLWTLIQ